MLEQLEQLELELAQKKLTVALALALALTLTLKQPFGSVTKMTKMMKMTRMLRMLPSFQKAVPAVESRGEMRVGEVAGSKCWRRTESSGHQSDQDQNSGHSRFHHLRKKVQTEKERYREQSEW
jgi:hypothetical protein